jgi:hypothetical protein
MTSENNDWIDGPAFRQAAGLLYSSARLGLTGGKALYGEELKDIVRFVEADRPTNTLALAHAAVMLLAELATGPIPRRTEEVALLSLKLAAIGAGADPPP